VGIFNTSDRYQTITVKLSDIGAGSYKKVRDVWQQKTLPGNGQVVTTKVAPHGVVLVKVSK